MSVPSTHRFTDRVDNYAKYRPGYNQEIIGFLQRETASVPQAVVADIGSGTGIFTKLLLDAGFIVFAVEPNQAMRQKADHDLKDQPRYRSVNATAESTGLNDNSVDLIVCAQAFHWFDAARAKAEFQRILKPHGKVALIWNNRKVANDHFSVDYELLLQQYATDYKQVNHQNLTAENFAAFFKNGMYTLTTFPNVQHFDQDGLIGRAFSSSYVPAEDSAAGAEFLSLLKDIFSKHQVNNLVNMLYQTEVYLGEV